MKTAMFQQPEGKGNVRCSLCNHRCLIAAGKRGICAVRENREGTLYTLVYDKVIAQNIDPVEKKPLFHFLPGSRSFSIATPGCNFRCKHCQNADISQLPRDHAGALAGEAVSPADLVEAAKRNRCASISYTYTEPTIYFELAYDTARLAARNGLKNIFVTNGYITPEALREIRPFLHAANIDLKGFHEEFYREICGAKLQPVLDSIRLHRELGIWIEITTLVIPGHNDSDEELSAIAGFIKSVSDEIPWHVSAFHPTYKLADKPRTPRETLQRARTMGFDAGLRYVYEGNVPGEGEDTRCPECGGTVIERIGFLVKSNAVKAGKCGLCGAKIDGIWE